MLLAARPNPDPSPDAVALSLRPSCDVRESVLVLSDVKISQLFLPHFLSYVSMIRACHAEDLAWTARSFRISDFRRFPVSEAFTSVSAG